MKASLTRRAVLQFGVSAIGAIALPARPADTPPAAYVPDSGTDDKVRLDNPVTRIAKIRPGVRIAYEDQYFGAPWVKPETVVMLHGNGESSLAWTQWVGPLTTNFRVIRPDMPGFGNSPIPADYTWSPREIANDIGSLLAQLGVNRFHLVGAKYGGSVAVELAADQPARVITLSLIATPLKGNPGGDNKDLTKFPDQVRELGVRGFAAKTQRGRLGSKVSDAQLQWWTDALSEGLEPQVLIAATGAAAAMDLEPRLGDITAQTMVVTTEGSGLQTVDNVKRYQKMIAHSVLLVMPGDSYHVAASDPLACAQHVINFIEQGQA